ncbi:MAG: membrane-bound PQQ-dependent dehydrogenase, glucose/quinate/shikimate family, partial [Alphaproteobacteria bacterium]
MSAYRQDPTGSARPADHVALWARVLLVLVAAVLALSGLALLWLGGNIAWLGGTWYYVLAGLLLVATAVALGLGRHRSGLALFGLTLAATLAWSLFEIAGKGFMPAWGVDLGGRAGVMAGLFGFALFVWLTGRPPRHPRDRTRPFTFAAAAVVLVAAGAVLLVLWERPVEPATAAADIPPVPPEAETEVGHNGADTWLAFGGSPLGQRFSPAAEITPANVARLREAWRMRSGDLPPNDRVFFSSQNTPLKIGDSLYLCTSSNKVFALDPATGAERWRFDPQVPVKAMESLFSVACRAVAHYALQQPGPGPGCAAHVFVATVDSRLIALNPE